MIFIKRKPAPDFLTDTKLKWHKETEDAIAHYKDGNKSAFKFKAYNDPKLKAVLKEVFVKCAYCESNYSATSDGDVEHFRPKGKVKEKTPQTPGYYWLANDWDNLFLACQHCNQRRKHLLYGEDKLESYGKLDQFPLDSENPRLKDKEGVFDDEENARMLINPCKENPEIHLEYENLEAVVVPLTPKGERSVKVFVLQRHFLVIERKKKMLDLFEQMQNVLIELKRKENDKSLEQEQLFKRQYDRLMKYTNADESYAGMCRFFVKPFLKENGLDWT